MAFFNVLKGDYPGLRQIDKTLDVGSAETGIVRGSALYIDGSGSVPVFRLAGDTQATDPTATIYFSLMAQTDLVAGMAGTAGQGAAAGVTDPVLGTVSGVAKVTGLSCGMPLEFETDQYADTDYDVMALLTVGASGKLTPHSTGDNVVAQVTKAPATRWANNAEAVAGYRTGANVTVLTARTVWVPTLTVS